MQAVLAQHRYRIRDTRLRSSAILNACFDIHFLLFPNAANALPPVTLRPPPGIFQHGLDTSRPGSIHLRVIDILCASLQALPALGSRSRDYTQSVSLPRAMSLMAYCSRIHCVRTGPKRHHGRAPVRSNRAIASLALCHLAPSPQHCVAPPAVALRDACQIWRCRSTRLVLSRDALRIMSARNI